MKKEVKADVLSGFTSFFIGLVSVYESHVHSAVNLNHLSAHIA